MRTTCIVQARVGSSRLPAKTIADLGGRSIVERVVRRVARAASVDDVVVAVPYEDNADGLRLLALAAMGGAAIYVDTGFPAVDVLGRYVRCCAWLAGGGCRPDVVVRVCADSPFADPEIVDAVVAALPDAPLAYAGNTRRRTYPRGLCVEAFTARALCAAYDSVQDAQEHVTPPLKGDGVLDVDVADVLCPLGDLSRRADGRERRWCVDTAADLERCRALWVAVATDSDDDAFSWRDALAAEDRMEQEEKTCDG